jgi:hypothetical protein
MPRLPQAVRRRAAETVEVPELWRRAPAPHAAAAPDAEPWRKAVQAAGVPAGGGAGQGARRKCRAVIGGQRCQATTDLEVHHDPPLEQLWAQAGGDWALFVELATDERRLYALCRRHHAQADAIRRRRHES